MIYRIKNWDKNFETNKTREYKHCQRITFTNNLNKITRKRLVKGHKDGPGHLAAWFSICQYHSAQASPRQGFLTDNGKESGAPLTPDEIADLVDLPRRLVSVALDRLCSPEIGWMEAIPVEVGARSEYGRSTDGVQSSLLSTPLHSTPLHSTPKRDIAATSVPATFIELARTFLEKQKERFPKESALKDFEERVTDGASKLYLFHTSDNWTEGEIRDLLDWVLEDEFWCMQIRTLGGIRNRKKGRGSAMKFENARAAMETERNRKKQKSVMELLEEIEDESKATD